MIRFNDSVRDRFIRYTTYDTMSDGELCGKKRPTTPGQEELLSQLKKELEELGPERRRWSRESLRETLKALQLASWPMWIQQMTAMETE